MPAAGVRQQGVQDADLGVAEGEVGLVLALFGGDLPVAGALAGLGLAGGGSGLAGDGGDVPVAFLMAGAAAALAGGVVQGVRPAQEARCAPVGKRVMSTPISAMMSSAERRPQPGIDSACCSCSSYGASSRSITSVSPAISALTRSMRVSMDSSRAAIWGVKNCALWDGERTLGRVTITGGQVTEVGWPGSG